MLLVRCNSLLAYVPSNSFVFQKKPLALSAESYIQNARGRELLSNLGLWQVSASNAINASMIVTFLTLTLAAVVANNFLSRYQTNIFLAMYVLRYGQSVI